MSSITMHIIKLEERIKALEALTAGPAPEQPDHLERIEARIRGLVQRLDELELKLSLIRPGKKG